MARTLKESPKKLSWLLRLAQLVPPSKNTNDLKLSIVRRALKLALKKYSDGLESILDVYRKDFQEYNNSLGEMKRKLEEANKKEKAELEKQIKDTEKAIQDLQKEADEKAKEYEEENKAELTVNFDNEAFEYTKNTLGEAASDLFAVVRKDKDGNVVHEQYDSQSADELFEMLDKVK